MDKAGARPKFEFADGLRALAALTVAVLHATTFTGHLGDADENLPIIAKLMEIGNYAVPIFITLSGYVLMLPVARTANFELRGGFWKYIWRRGKRILPPYYAALILFIVMIAVIPALQTGHDTAWDNKVPITPWGVVSHFLLIHNWRADWIYQIDGPAWSVATEWHIYFIMPLILLPLCRWLNPWVMLVVALLLGPALSYALPGVGPANYWMIGLFALGMMAALYTVRGTPRIPSHWFGWAGIGLFLIAVAWQLTYTPHARHEQIISDTLAGAGIALGLVAMGQTKLAGRTNLGVRILEWRPLVFLGLFSYSIYLIHSPLLALANILMLPLELPTLANWLVLVLVVIPIAVAASYGFFWLVERHFITSHQKRALADKAGEDTIVRPVSTP
ncbi:acyltransferase [Herbiconiux sp.]|uniref:acyltransferase family protein n=1 Tax=Herbiconiux sp. TaxID=1871186 RepID=UPI0025B853ED|nr:acyltransferase [Herbiconiux sp.]